MTMEQDKNNPTESDFSENPGGPGESSTENPSVQVADVSQHKALAIVGYIFPILFFLPLITDAKENEFARFHANQQLNLLLFWVIGQAAASFLTVILIGLLLIPLVTIAGFIFLILGVMNVVNNRMKPLPVIGKFRLLD